MLVSVQCCRNLFERVHVIKSWFYDACSGALKLVSFRPTQNTVDSFNRREQLVHISEWSWGHRWQLFWLTSYNFLTNMTIFVSEKMSASPACLSSSLFSSTIYLWAAPNLAFPGYCHYCISKPFKRRKKTMRFSHHGQKKAIKWWCKVLW